MVVSRCGTRLGAPVPLDTGQLLLECVTRGLLLLLFRSSLIMFET
jgi:hypothetical protein